MNWRWRACRPTAKDLSAYSTRDGKIGTYVADLVVENAVIVELKAIGTPIGTPHMTQCLNYLRASALRTALIPNFGKPRLEYKRVTL